MTVGAYGEKTTHTANLNVGIHLPDGMNPDSQLEELKEFGIGGTDNENINTQKAKRNNKTDLCK